MRLRYVLILASWPNLVWSFSKPLLEKNSLRGIPLVDCGSRMVTVTVETTRPFHGNMYIKGYFHRPECRLTGNEGKLSGNTLTLPIDPQCGMRRRRMTKPRGLLLDSTVVVMFHPVFMTSMDKSFHVQCHYLEKDTKVFRHFDVSTHSPTELPNNEKQIDSDGRMPTCKYEVLQGGPSGKLVTVATIGEKVYHKWSCEMEEPSLYCMTVHSCNADDGEGNGQHLIDQEGCSLDDFLLRNLNYTNGQLVAAQESSVFKFADRPTIFFSCMIRLEMKEELGGGCQRPQEYCSDGMQNAPNGEIIIENDFPRPKNTTLDKSQVVSSQDPMMSDAQDYEQSYDTVDYHSELGVRKAKTRWIRASSSFAMDVGVEAPSLEVVDLPEIDPAEKPPKRKDVPNTES